MAACAAGCGTVSRGEAASAVPHTTQVSHTRNPSSDSTASQAVEPGSATSVQSPSQAQLAGFTRLVQPQPTHPLKVLVIGDSLGEDLQYGLEDIAGSSSDLDIIPKAYGSSGLINTAFYNWPKMFAQYLRQYHPQLVYVVLGTNDTYGFYASGQYVAYGSALWRKVYGGRVNGLLVEAQHAGAHVIWVGLPIMSRQSVLSDPKVRTMNALIASEVRRHPAIAAFVPTWKLFAGPQGQFEEYMKDSEGVEVMVRDPDGVHIAPPAGQELLASYVLSQTEQVAHVALCVNGSDLWRQYALKACPARR